MGRRIPAHVTCSVLFLRDNIINRLADPVGMLVETKMSQHHAAREDERSGVCLIFALNVETDVSATGFEDGHLTTHIAPRYDTRSADEAGSNVGQDTSVEVWHDHDVELLGLAYALHACVVDDHVIRFDRRIVLAHLFHGVAEEPVGELHDIGLVDACDFSPVVCQRKGEGELGDPLGLYTSDDLKRLDDAGDRLMFEAGVLAFGVLTDDAEIDVLVSCLVAGDVLDEHD